MRNEQMRGSKSHVTLWYFRTSGPKYVFLNLTKVLLLALTPAWSPLHVPSAWTPLNPSLESPASPSMISHPPPPGRGDSFSLTVSVPPASSHGAFFVLLLYNLPCYTVISDLSLSHSTKSSWEPQPHLTHGIDAQYVFG